MSGDLAAFILARIAEEDDEAKRAAFGWGASWQSVTDSAEGWSVVHADGQRDMVGCEDGDVTRHIARHDPARVLTECDAKRRIVEELSFDGLGPRKWILRLLATPYADHPSYREEWRP